MTTLITFALGWIAGLATFTATFIIEALRLLRRSADINDAPCLVCNRQQCACGEHQ